jgi:hypothetical protein
MKRSGEGEGDVSMYVNVLESDDKRGDKSETQRMMEKVNRKMARPKVVDDVQARREGGRRYSQKGGGAGLSCWLQADIASDPRGLMGRLSASKVT